MLVPDFAALRYFFHYRFPDVIIRLIRESHRSVVRRTKIHRDGKRLQCNEQIG
jgi:hypothetical protein